MAEGPAGMIRIEPPPRDPRPIEAEIVRRREELTMLVAELNRRRHELTGLDLQLRRQAMGVLVTVLATGVAAAGSVVYARWRTRRRNALLAKGGHLREAVGRMIDRPQRVAVQPSVTEQVVGSAVSAAAAFLFKAALERLGRSERERTGREVPGGGKSLWARPGIAQWQSN
jgi:hypothetical protein